MIDAREQVARARIVGARLDADGALRDRRQKFFDVHDARGAIRQGRAASGRRAPGSWHRPRRRRACAAASRHCRAAARCADRAARACAIACRRSDAVPSVAPCGSSASERALRLMKTSRASSRSRHAASTRPAGSTVGMSLAECTARSMSPRSSASSISLVNRPLPPTSASGRSWMLSPVVRMTLSVDRLLVAARAPRRAARAPCAPAPAPADCRACRSAGRVPRIALDDLAMLGRTPNRAGL